ncbi:MULTISPECIES: ribosomal protein S18-alanine N-acetyltransferase [Exiguobacterium]|uniref:ribosomal protein S18-alanine N-acetyltransferase n=1 Tax=Exiguobacterium TaxID=33986 RepID=UPI001BADD433|nr:MULTISPECIES: ribosomal protein S18-alanine N-acetyltransferase [Exiguobacterium]MCT4784663.1 ribosomal protein S18-alanine N-acetyltransferase [Exiguobacterium himgiriensis]QUE86369.1 ribosomal protein S18-alanine N-acetyltransferase [Exiguobacterium alkaliphilum]
MADITIRRMTWLDVEEVTAVEEASFAIPWTKEAFMNEMLRNEQAIYFVAVHDRRVIGFAGVWKIVDEGHITNIAVLPEYRGQGVGNQLLHALVTYARAQSLAALTLEVRVSNVGAQKLYEQFGFECAGRRKRYYQDNNEDALIYWAKLGSETE